MSIKTTDKCYISFGLWSFMSMHHKRILFGLSISILFSCHWTTHPKQMEIDRIYIENSFNKEKRQIFEADSLLTILRIEEALEKYRVILKSSDISDNERLYITSKLERIEDEFALKKGSGYKLRHTKGDQFHYYIRNDFEKINIDTLLYNEQKAINHADKANALHQLSLYYDLVDHQPHLSQQYANKMSHLLAPLDYTTIWHYRNTLQLVNLNSYKRKNVKALSLLQKLIIGMNEPDKMSTKIISKICEQRAFLLLRLSLLEEAKIQIDSIYKLNYKEKCNPFISSANRLTLFVDLISGDKTSFHANTNTFKRVNSKCDGGLLGIDEMLGRYYLSNGQIDSADFYLQKAKARYSKKDRTSIKIQKTISYMLSEVHQAKRQYDEALDEYSKHLDIGLKQFEPSFFLKSKNDGLYNYADLLRFASILYSRWEQSGLKKDLHLATSLLKKSETMSTSVFSTFDEHVLLRYLIYHDELYELLVSSSYDLYEQDLDSKYLEASWTYTSKQFNILFQRDLLLNSARGAIDPNLIVKKKEIELSLKRMISEGLLSHENLGNYVEAQEALDEQLRSHLNETPPYQLNDRIDDISERLNSDESLITYAVAKNRLYRFHKSKKELSATRKPIDKEDLEILDSLRSMYVYPKKDDLSKYKKYSSAINKLLFDSRFLESTKAKWYIMLDPTLGSLSFNALLTDTTGRNFCELNYLLEKKNISYILTDQLRKHPLKENSSNTNDQITGFAFSSPNTHKNTHKSRLSELAGSYREIQSLKDKYVHANVYSGCEATLPLFEKSLKEDPRLLHLSLHGNTNNEVMDRSYLYFRDDNCNVDSFYGFDLLNYKLPNTKVILSSCSSDQGKVQFGEGNFSLTRYFFLSGAKEVISSCWDINDMSTAALFDAYYSHANEDLRTSQVQSLTNPETCHPYFWGGFLRYDRL